jgi:hypothetical protein
MRARTSLAVATLAVVLGSATSAAAQYDATYYENLYGPIVEVSLSDLAFNPQSYEGRGVRVRGRLETDGIGARAQFALADVGARALLFPVSGSGSGGESEFQDLSGQVIDVTGVFRSANAQSLQNEGAFSQTGRYSGIIQYWSWLGPPEKIAGKIKAAIASLEDLVSRPGKLDGQIVRVTGRFRGRNLFGDLPARSMRVTSDWVIKDSLYAVWVTGRKPKGDGFDLDPGIRRDTSRWLEVVGRPRTRNGVVVIEAATVSLTTPPSPARSEVAPAPPPPERPKIPPVIVFSLPIEGEGDFDASGRIVVQFNNDMNEDTFKGRVGLRYAGAVRPGDPGFAGMRVTYNAGQKALVVDPGGPILRGRPLELVLLKGILDVDDQPLARRDGRALSEDQDIVEVLRFVGNE